MFVLLLVYCHRIFYFYRGLSRLRPGTNVTVADVCVIIPARNEEQTIGNCLSSLLSQRYPKEHIRIIVVDDHSTDRTMHAASSIASRSPIPITVIPVNEFSEITSPKLRALAHGLQQTTAEIILTIDADCTAPPDWIATVLSYFDNTVGVVTGVTTYKRTDAISSMFLGVQFLDFISYTSIAAGAIGMGRVLITNGSNMAFRREALVRSGGFASIKNINSGDDSLLAQQIVAGGAWEARFAYQKEAAIATLSALSIKEFFHQRMRWVGQTAYYPADMMFFLICTFLMFVGLAVSIPLSIIAPSAGPWFILAGKFTVDFIMMRKFTSLISAQETMRYFLPTAIIHIPYILMSTIGGYFFPFEWKNRTLTKETGP
jgi:cellulose synthase/poly-beta-1,6-N-acetylglucosamine synthase-like glycosyltransferase